MICSSSMRVPSVSENFAPTASIAGSIDTSAPMMKSCRSPGIGFTCTAASAGSPQAIAPAASAESTRFRNVFVFIGSPHKKSMPQFIAFIILHFRSVVFSRFENAFTARKKHFAQQKTSAVALQLRKLEVFCLCVFYISIDTAAERLWLLMPPKGPMTDWLKFWRPALMAKRAACWSVLLLARFTDSFAMSVSPSVLAVS